MGAWRGFEWWLCWVGAAICAASKHAMAARTTEGLQKLEAVVPPTSLNEGTGWSIWVERQSQQR